MLELIELFFGIIGFSFFVAILCGIIAHIYMNTPEMKNKKCKYIVYSVLYFVFLFFVEVAAIGLEDIYIFMLKDIYLLGAVIFIFVKYVKILKNKSQK